MGRLLQKRSQASGAESADSAVAGLREAQIDPSLVRPRRRLTWSGRAIPRDEAKFELIAERRRQSLEALVGSAGIIARPEAPEQHERHGATPRGGFRTDHHKSIPWTLRRFCLNASTPLCFMKSLASSNFASISMKSQNPCMK